MCERESLPRTCVSEGNFPEPEREPFARVCVAESTAEECTAKSWRAVEVGLMVVLMCDGAGFAFGSAEAIVS